VCVQCTVYETSVCVFSVQCMRLVCVCVQCTVYETSVCVFSVQCMRLACVCSVYSV